MKNFSTTFALLFLVTSINAQTNVLHLNLGSHNEMSDPAYGVNYQTNYSSIKSKALLVADSVLANEAKWNMQVESNFIRACLQFDNAAASSNDLMEWMDNLPYVEVDPHNHLDTIVAMNPNFNPYNYADLNHLLDSCGLSNRTNVGGFIYKAQDWTTDDEDWTVWKYGLQGRTFPWINWIPQVLWGGGTLNHVDDPQPIGVWHPGGPTTATFLTNNDTQLLDIGNGCAWLIKDTTTPSYLIAEINNYIATINSTTANSNTFYTATIMFDFRSILTPGYTDKIAEVLRGLRPLVASGDIVWETLSEKRTDWLSNHNNTSDSFIKVCDDINVGVEEPISDKTNFTLYPNPTSSSLNIQFSQNNSAASKISIYNFVGVKIIEIEIEKNSNFIQTDVSTFTKGMYILTFESDTMVESKTFVIE